MDPVVQAVTRRYKAAKELARKGNRYNTSFYGTDDGKWDAVEGFILGAIGGRYDWEMLAGMSSQNEWRAYVVEGATEHSPGFRRALREIVREYPELLDFVIRFDGPWQSVRDLVGGTQETTLNWKNLQFYHGTSLSAWEDIQHQGLKPRAATNVVPAYGAGSSAKEGRKDAIYLTTQITMAHFAALEAAERSHSEPVILSIKGLDGEYMAADEDSGEIDPAKSLARIGSVAYITNIPSSRIELFETIVDRKWVRMASVQAVARRYLATITKASLEKWKKDLRVMTKIYRDIPVERGMTWDAPEEEKEEVFARCREARDLFRNFHNNFEEWVYRTVLPKTESGKEPYLQEKIRSSAWNFLAALSPGTLFPDRWTGQGGGENRVYDLSELRKKREGNIKRYQVAATKTFTDLGDYLEQQDGALERRTPVDHYEVGGVNVVVKNWGRDLYTEGTEEDLQETFSLLRETLNQVKRAGFPEAVRGLGVTVDFDSEKGLVAGKYQAGADILTLYPLGIGRDTGRGGLGTLVHEIGHRYWFRELPGQARAHWTEVMEARGVKITGEDVTRFSKLVEDKAKSDPWLSEDEVLKMTLPHAEGVEDAVKFKELSRTPFVPVFSGSREFDPANYVDRLKSFHEGETVQLEEISEYANESAVEAFAECFWKWVLQGPRALGEWTREFFKKVSRAGGAKVAMIQKVHPVGAGASPDSEKWDIIYSCGHQVTAERSGGVPVEGDLEPCPVCGGKAAGDDLSLIRKLVGRFLPNGRPVGPSGRT